MSGWTPLRKALAFAAVAMAFAVAATGWALFGSRDDAVVVNADPTNPELVALGRQVYAESCASCHGASLQGQANWRTRRADGKLPAPPHDASGHTWHHDDATLFTLVKFGPAAIAGTGYSSDMPGYEGTLSDRQIEAVLAYIKSTWPAEIRTTQAEITRQAQGQR